MFVAPHPSPEQASNVGWRSSDIPLLRSVHSLAVALLVRFHVLMLRHGADASVHQSRGVSSRGVRRSLPSHGKKTTVPRELKEAFTQETVGT